MKVVVHGDSSADVEARRAVSFLLQVKGYRLGVWFAKVARLVINADKYSPATFTSNPTTLLSLGCCKRDTYTGLIPDDVQVCRVVAIFVAAFKANRQRFIRVGCRLGRYVDTKYV